MLIYLNTLMCVASRQQWCAELRWVQRQRAARSSWWRQPGTSGPTPRRSSSIYQKYLWTMYNKERKQNYLGKKAYEIIRPTDKTSYEIRSYGQNVLQERTSYRQNVLQNVLQTKRQGNKNVQGQHVFWNNIKRREWFTNIPKAYIV